MVDAIGEFLDDDKHPIGIPLSDVEVVGVLVWSEDFDVDEFTASVSQVSLHTLEELRSEALAAQRFFDVELGDLASHPSPVLQQFPAGPPLDDACDEADDTGGLLGNEESAFVLTHVL